MEIIVYSSVLCPYCKAAKELLESLDLKYKEILIDKENQIVVGKGSVIAKDSKGKFVKDFISAWTKVMNLDLFDLN